MMKAYGKKHCVFWRCLCILTLAVLSSPVFAEPLTFDITEDKVEITTGFTGTELTLFGHKTQRGDVVAVLEGPLVKTRVRRKTRVFGAWVNRASLSFEDVPSYYDYATNAQKLDERLAQSVLKERRIGLSSLRVMPEKAKYDEKTTKIFQDALLRNKQEDSLFPQERQAVEFLNESLFRVDFHLPANVPSGVYSVRMLLIDGDRVVYEQRKDLQVRLGGFGSAIYDFSNRHGFFYGLMCVLFAGFAGWISNVIVRRN